MSAAGLLASQADRSALAEVLADPEFQAQRWSGDQLRRWLAWWWERLTDLLGTSEAERWAGLGRAVFLATALVALLLAWRAVRRRQRQATAGARAHRDRPAEVQPPRATKVEVAEAERALAAGDAVEAVRLAFLAAVGALQQRLPTATADVLTGSELAAWVADEEFGRLARLHERTVFGRRPVSPEEALAALAVAARMSSGARAGPPRPAGEGAP